MAQSKVKKAPIIHRPKTKADGDISELEPVEEEGTHEEPQGKRCGECGSPTVEVKKDNKKYLVCQDAMREDPLCSWYEEIKSA